MKIFYSSHERTIALVLLSFLLGATIGLLVKVEKNPVELIIPALTTLLAAFLGAWYAFRLQNKRDDLKKHQSNVEAANRALFSLSRIINELEVIRQQVIEPVRNRPDRFLAMQPFLIPNYDELKFSIESLSFLLESKSPNILGELIVEETNFHQAISSVKNRSDIHRYQVQPLLERAGVVVGGEYSMSDIEVALGQRIFVQIRLATDSLIEHVDETLVSSEELMKKFVAAMMRFFPKSKFITLERHQEPNQEMQP